jgi:uncharacterized membrane protein YraQ (UPF0718 family)
MVDLGSLVLLMSIFGARIAIVYVVMGLMIAVAGGTYTKAAHMKTIGKKFDRWYDLLWMQKKL